MVCVLKLSFECVFFSRIFVCLFLLGQRLDVWLRSGI